mmetsp:Transcript_26563/g.39452  ORF Transcript_26563/g.39452 Transcript_26563/m.39452 type:complete len:325 (+) Transcript_26563:36-1010(+)
MIEGCMNAPKYEEISSGAVKLNRRPHTVQMAVCGLFGLFCIGFIFYTPMQFQSASFPLKETRVLVTGFEPFSGYDQNPSGDVADSIHGKCTDFKSHHTENAKYIRVCFEGLVLPVNSTGSSSVADMLHRGDSVHYDAVLHLGLEDSAKGLKLETFGINHQADGSLNSHGISESCLSNTDADENIGTPAVPGAECQLPTTADMGRLSLEEALVYALDVQCTDPRHGKIRCKSAGEVLRSQNIPGILKLRLRKHLLEVWSRDAGTFFCNETLFRTLHAIRTLSLRVRSGALMPALFTHLPSYEHMSLHEMTLLVEHIGSQLASFSI